MDSSSQGALGPLLGQRIVLARAGSGGEDYRLALETEGASVTICRVVRTVPPHDPVPFDDALRRLDQYEWLLLTSRNTVEALHSRLDALQATAHPKSLAVIGPATRQAVEAMGWKPTLSPARNDSYGLLEAMRHEKRGSVLLPQSNIADSRLAETLSDFGFSVTRVEAYQTIEDVVQAAQASQLIASGSIDAVIVSSPSTLRAVRQAIRTAGQATKVISLGQTTAAACQEAGIHAAAVADEPAPAGIVRAVIAAIGN